MRYDKALEVLAPGAEWELFGTKINWVMGSDNKLIPDPNTLVWKSPHIPMPSKDDIETEAVAQQKIIDALAYQRQRALEYPPLTNLADALYHQANGDNSKMEAYLAACEAVKQKYPKGIE